MPDPTMRQEVKRFTQRRSQASASTQSMLACLPELAAWPMSAAREHASGSVLDGRQACQWAVAMQPPDSSRDCLASFCEWLLRPRTLVRLRRAKRPSHRAHLVAGEQVCAP